EPCAEVTATHTLPPSAVWATALSTRIHSSRRRASASPGSTAGAPEQGHDRPGRSPVACRHPSSATVRGRPGRPPAPPCPHLPECPRGRCRPLPGGGPGERQQVVDQPAHPFAVGLE